MIAPQEFCFIFQSSELNCCWESKALPPSIIWSALCHCFRLCLVGALALFQHMNWLWSKSAKTRRKERGAELKWGWMTRRSKNHLPSPRWTPLAIEEGATAPEMSIFPISQLHSCFCSQERQSQVFPCQTHWHSWHGAPMGGRTAVAAAFWHRFVVSIAASPLHPHTLTLPLAHRSSGVTEKLPCINNTISNM